MPLTCDPETLAVNSACFNCFDEGQKLNVLIYLFAQVAGVTTDPQTLAVASKCFQCIPEGNKMNVLLYLACNFSGGAGGGGSSVFAASAGTVPPTAPTTAGMTAFNQTTNEEWFVNNSLAWQQIIGT